MTSADFVKKMQDSMQQQQSRGEMAVIDLVHDANVAATNGPEKWLALKTLVAQSAGEINRGWRPMWGWLIPREGWIASRSSIEHRTGLCRRVLIP